MTKMMRTLLVLAPALAALAFLVPDSLADESKRRSLRDEIDRLLSDIAGELRDVPSDSSTSDLDRTVDYAGRVVEKALDLKNVAENDSDARRIGEQYPDIARRYRDYVKYLREMKTQQRRGDEWPKKCTEAVRELDGKLQALTERHNPRATEEIPRLAREYGKIGKESLEQAERLRYEMAGWYDRVDDFGDSDGKWSDVRSYMHGAGRTMLEHVQRQQEQMKREEVCGNLSLEDRNPSVARAMQKLLEGKNGIEVIYTAVDRMLGETAGYLDGLQGDSNASDIDQARRKLEELERMTEQLDRIRGNDDEAKKRVDQWRANIAAGRQGLDHLKVLKDSQFLADRAPEKCRETGDRLKEVIRGFVDKKDVAGKRQIPLRARAFAEPIKAGLAKTDEQHSVMERALSDAQRFSPSDGPWRTVGEKHRASAQGVFDYWTKARQAAHAACDELSTGDQAREVKEAIALLEGGASAEIDRFKRDVDAWNTDARSLFVMDCTELDAIWLAMCGADEERNESPDREEARATARVIGGQMRGRVDPMMRRYDDLKKRGDDLIKEDETKDRATAIMATMNEVHAKFERIERGGSLKGADHPMSQYAAEHGKQMHDDYASKYSCTIYDKAIGSVGRPDCIVVDSTCWVYEFKPDTAAAERKGERQLNDYVPAVTRFYQERITGKQGNDSSDYGKFTSAVESKCVKSGSVFFDRKVIKYPLCEKKFECTR